MNFDFDIDSFSSKRQIYDLPWIFNGIGFAVLMLLGFIFFMVRFGRLSKQRPETRKDVIIAMLSALLCLGCMLVSVGVALYGFQGIPSSQAP